jgi:two-component system response regulator LytT
MMRVLIIEDEPVIARRMARIAQAALADAEVLSAGSVAEAEALLAAGVFDILFLDLNLSGEDGFAMLGRTIARPSCVIVVSASPHRAVEGFDHEIVDFVAKPFSEERLQAAIDRGLAKLRNLPSRTLAVRVRNGWRFVRLAEIDHVRAADDYCELVLEGGERLLHSASLDRLARDLPPAFRRVHRSAIANFERVSTVRRRASGAYEILTQANSPLPVGRAYLAQLRTAGVLPGASVTDPA